MRARPSRSLTWKLSLAFLVVSITGALVYQLAVLHRFQTGGNLRRGLKPFLQAA